MDKIPLDIRDDSISWIAADWRFYIANDGNEPYWGFVHKGSPLEMESGVLSKEEIKGLLNLLESE